MGIPRALPATLLVVALSIGTSSCTDDPEPIIADPTPTPTAESTPTETEEAKEPWEERTEAGVEAFATLAMMELFKAQSSGNTGRFRELGPECRDCANYADQIERFYGDGGWFRLDGPYEVLAFKMQGDLGDQTSAGIRVRSLGGEYRSSESSDPQPIEAGEDDWLVSVEWTKSSWLLTQLVPVQ